MVKVMTKQEKIREGLAVKLASFEGRNYWRMTDVDKEYWLAQAHSSLEYLHSQGVVVRVERELPKNPNKARNEQIDDKPRRIVWAVAHSVGWRDGWASGRDDIIDAGYVAVKPLIKE